MDTRIYTYVLCIETMKLIDLSINKVIKLNNNNKTRKKN